MVKTSLRALGFGLLLSMSVVACGNDDSDPVVTPPTPTPNPNPDPTPSTAFAFGSSCSGASADECGADGQCVQMVEGGAGICTGPCGTNDEAGWTTCANNQTGNANATAACIVSDPNNVLYCAALCGTFEDPQNGPINLGTCDPGFTCQLGALQSDSVDLSQAGVCG